MLRRITNLLKTWEGSKLDGETSKEILDLIEANGMVPSRWLVSEDKLLFTWEPENEEK